MPKALEQTANSKESKTVHISAHTPGPWQYDARRECIYAENHSLIAKIATGEDRQEEDANSALIAAAPEMFAALDAVYTAQVLQSRNLNDKEVRQVAEVIKRMKGGVK